MFEEFIAPVSGLGLTALSSLPPITTLLDASEVGTWHRLLGDSHVVWSPEAQRIQDAPARRESAKSLMARVHPDDRSHLMSEIRRAFSRPSGVTVHYRVIGESGALREIEARVECLRNTGGRAYALAGTVVDLSARRAAIELYNRTERWLSQSYSRFRQLADAMPLIVSIADTDGVIEYLNRTFEAYTGLPSAGLTASWLSAVHADDLNALLASGFEERLARGESMNHEMRVLRADGEYRWHLGQIVPIRSETGEVVKWYATAQDIHDQRLMSEHASQLARRLQATLDSITDAFFTVDNDWRIIYANDPARQSFIGGLVLPSTGTLWDHFPAIVGTEFEHNYRRALRERRAVHFEASFGVRGNWLEVNAYPSDDGLAIYVRDITTRKQIEEKVHFLAMYDPLTRLPNRRLWRDRLEHALAASKRTGRKAAILFIDLDDFKTLNDTLGHDLGDRMLQQVAERLQKCVRATDTVARLGGDEFVVLLDDLDADDREAAIEAELVARKVLQRLSEPFLLDAHERVRSASIGVALLGYADDSAEELMKRADMAMYQAKASGRQTLRFFDPAMQAAVTARAELEGGLRRALAEGELRLVYQPQVDRQGRVRGAEALLRWQVGDAMTGPDVFIPVAEETGLIMPIGRWVLAEACTQLARWQQCEATAALTLSVNVSARQFRHEDFVATVTEVLAESGAPPHRLKLELTESVLLEDVEAAVIKMAALNSLGISFSLDDFGTGYSSLFYLKRLAFDELKIDKRFVADVTTNPNDAAIVRAILALAEALGLSVIAEGVETEDALAYLRRERCDGYQGYLFSRPVPLAEFETLLSRPLGAGSAPAS